MRLSGSPPKFHDDPDNLALSVWIGWWSSTAVISRG